MSESRPTTPQFPPSACLRIRKARHLPDLFEQAANLFREASGSSFVLVYLMVSEDEAIELSFAGKPPARSREIRWLNSMDPAAAPWLRLEAAEILPIEHQGSPYALIVLGPRESPRPASQSQALRLLCQATSEALNQTLLQTWTLAADFQQQRANRHRRHAKRLDLSLRQVSHDLRNHLVPMLYATEELQEILDAPDVLKLLIKLERQIRLADQFSRHVITTLTHPACASKSDMGLIAREAVEGWQSAFDRQQLAFTLCLPEGPVWVDGPAISHHQVLGNLLSNALKFTPPGGRILLSLTPHEGFCLLEVTNSGRGIGSAFRRKLFEAQVREDAGVEGHGLGLTNVQAVLQSLGGSISVTSAPGRGATFQVRLKPPPAAE